MRVGDIPRKVKSFDDRMLIVWAKPSHLRHRLLKTMQATGYFTDDLLLSRLMATERAVIQQKHLDTMAGERKYQLAQSYDIGNMLPKYVNVEVETVRYMGEHEGTHLVCLKGFGQEVFAEAGAFLSLRTRHPKAKWRMGHGKFYWKKPLVLLESEGVYAGELLGALATIPIERKKPTTSNHVWKRVYVKNHYYYRPVRLKEKQNAST